MTNQLPAHLLNRQSRNLAGAAVSGLASGAPPHISIARGRFTLVDSAGNKKPLETLHLDVIVVDVNQAVSKVFYEGEFDPTAEDYAPPTCFSDNGKGASAQATMPQAISCMMCPHNQWGSDTSKVTGKGTKACNDYKKLAVIIPGDPDEITYLLRIPPASLKLWKNYATTIGSRPLPDKSRNFDLSDVVTRVTFDEKIQGVLNFKPIGYIDEDDSARIDEIWAENKADILIGRNDMLVTPDRIQLTGGPKAAPQAVAAPVAVAPQPKAIAQFTPPETTPAATKRRGRPPKTEPVSPPATPQASAPADDAEIPPFLRREPQQEKPQEAPKPQFGLEQPKAPPADLAASIEAAFKLPT